MQKYDVQELLRQEKNNVFEHILTVVLAITLGVSTSFIFEGLKEGDTQKTIIPVFVVAILIGSILILVYINRKTLIKTREENFILLTCFDMEENPKPIAFNEYPFSVSTKNIWDSVIGNDNTIIKMFTDDHKENTNLYGNYSKKYTKYFDYKVMSDLVQYLILREISPLISDKPKQNRTHIVKFIYNLLSNYVVRRPVQILRTFTYIDEYYRKRESLKYLHFTSNGIPLICLPNQIKENLFVVKRHQEQLNYEKKILLEGKNRLDLDGHLYLPLNINLPNGVKINLENSENSKIKKIILIKDKIGTLSIEFHDRWRLFSQRTFVQTAMRPGNHRHKFEEIFFEITINFNIKKYAYFPLIGGGEKSVDEFFSWGTKLIDNIEKTFDWNYYQEHITRDMFQDLRNKLDYTDWESRIEYYDNFDETKKGNIERLLRFTISPNFEEKKAALEQISEKKDEIPDSLLEMTILRIIRLTHSDIHTCFTAVKTLKNLLDIIPNNLHDNVVDRLLILINYENRVVKIETFECLSEITKYLNNSDLKNKVEDEIINLHVLKTELLFPRHSSKALENIYPDMSRIRKDKLEAKYLHMLKLNDEEEIVQSLIFYEYILEFVSDSVINKVFELAAKINLSNVRITTIEEYFRFLLRISKLTNQIPFNEDITKNHYDNIIALIDNLDNNTKKGAISKIAICGPFICTLNDLKRDVIYYKLKSNVYSTNNDISYLASEAICYLVEFFPGKYDDIVEMMLHKVNSYDADNHFKDIVSSICFEQIKNEITDEKLKNEVNQFQKNINNS